MKLSTSPFWLYLFIMTGCGGGGGGSGSSPPVAIPVITSQPAAQTIDSGQSAAFAVTATGATGFQWQRNGAAIAGATSSSYTLASAVLANDGEAYSVVVSNAGGSVTSAAAALRVTGVAVLAGQLGGIGFADGGAGQARFWGPAALALDAAGNLYVADYNTVRKVLPAGTVSTVVGTARECGEVFGPGTTARLCFPFAITADPAGNLYVGEGSSTIYRVDTNDTLSAHSTGFNCPSSLTNDGSLLYVGDSCGGSVGSIRTVNLATPAAPATFVTVNGPLSGLAFDGSSNLYVASSTMVQVVTPAAAVSIVAGTANITGSADGTGAAAAFGCAQYPVGANYFGKNGAVAVVTANGVAYVADYCNHTIRTVSPGGVVTTIAGSAGAPGAVDGSGASARFFGPAALVADGAGNVFVADYLNGLIRKITPAGVVSTVAGQMPHAGSTDGAALQAAFRYPEGVVADSAGNLYVTDTYNFVIRKITPAGVVSTLAGTPGVAGFANGTGSAAKFALPRGIAIDASGNLYVADDLNDVVRKVTPAGVVTTFAGVPGQMAPFNEPVGVAVDASGNVYVTDLNGIYKADAAGTVAPLLAAVVNAEAITVARTGTVYFAGGSPKAVNSLSAANVVTVIATAGLSARLPGLIVAADGNLYLTDLGNSALKKVATDGSGAITVIAGGPALPMGTVPGGLRSGPGQAKLNSPSGLAALPGGSVSFAVVDSFEHALLRVNLP